MSKLWMISYDISDDRIRRDVYEILKNHGERVQYSVFECRLDAGSFSALRARIKALIEPQDSLRWYPLCAWCQGRIDRQGCGRPADHPDFYMV
jgi:CRISPR-associated protein Cas2